MHTFALLLALTLSSQQPESTTPTRIIPINLTFSGHKETLSAADKTKAIITSPIFQATAFPNATTQYGAALQIAQSTTPSLLAQPTTAPPLNIEIPAANGYLLHSQHTNKTLAIVDLDFIQSKLPAATPGTLTFYITRNTAFYVLGDATVCCSVGTHSTYILASYFDPAVYPHFTDIQAITQQLAEYLNEAHKAELPAWRKPSPIAGCGGRGQASSYLMEQPTDFTPNNATTMNGYHLENIALLSWFKQVDAPAYSFPNPKALTAHAQPCNVPAATTATAIPNPSNKSGHALIGYWEGYSTARNSIPLRDISRQWDIVITTFATPVKGSTALLHFAPPANYGEDRYKADVAYLKSLGKKVLISIGGGGQVVTINTPQDLKDFVTSVTAIVQKYGFDGVDLDIETPSLLINPTTQTSATQQRPPSSTSSPPCASCMTT